MFKEMKLKAEGIICMSCAEDMETLLREKEGILDAHVNYAEELISVKYDPSIMSSKEVYAAVRRLGFHVKILSDN
ncbi:MAG: heavy-metal-associated domain-containing protein [Nitrospirae bacterium]|nr:heavy-metal-associated domain-containing protein [Nitrospirota bacterium]